MIRAFNLGFTHALKHEKKFIKNGNGTRNVNASLNDNIINENNIHDVIDQLNNTDFG